MHTRSELTFRDEGAKFGTEVDGERISNATRVLNNDEHVFKLGNTPHSFRYVVIACENHSTDKSKE